MTRPQRIHPNDPPVVQAPRPAAGRPLGRTLVEVAVGVAMIVIAVGVYLKLDLGWALIVGGVLTAAFALVIVDLPSRPVHTGSRRGED